ncbi:MAG: hypothetical protein AAF492_14230, partial [Verrucomicrobiota bacterium]
MVKRILCGLAGLLTAHALQAGELSWYANWADPLQEPPRNPPSLLDGLGQVSFPITCNKPETQRFFNQGMAMVFGFDLREAARSFRLAAQLEPDCAMAWWGLALTQLEHPRRMRTWLRSAMKQQNRRTLEEQSRIEALYRLLPPEAGEQPEIELQESRSPHHSHSRIRIKKTETAPGDPARDVVESFANHRYNHPRSLEARALYLHALIGRPDRIQTRRQAEQIDGLLDEMLTSRAEHPLWLSRAQLWHRFDPVRAARYLKKALSIMPANPQAWSRAGEMLTRWDRFKEARDHDEKAVQLFEQRLRQRHLMPDEIPGYAKTRDRLAANLARTGYLDDGLELAYQMAEEPCSRASTVDGFLAPDPESHRVYGARHVIRLLTERKAWDSLSAWAEFPRFSGPDIQLDLAHALGRSALDQDDADGVNTALNRLRDLYEDAVDLTFVKNGHKRGFIRDPVKAATALPLRVKRIEQHIEDLLEGGKDGEKA